MQKNSCEPSFILVKYIKFANIEIVIALIIGNFQVDKIRLRNTNNNNKELAKYTKNCSSSSIGNFYYSLNGYLLSIYYVQIKVSLVLSFYNTTL